MAADGGPVRRRVFVEDARRNGQFLRVTWHGEEQQFVVSNWDDNVCVGATRVPVASVPDLVGLLVDGLADASRPSDASRPPTSLREHLVAWWRARRRRAVVLPLRSSPTGRARRSA
jgi:hypothetical protein